MHVLKLLSLNKLVAVVQSSGSSCPVVKMVLVTNLKQHLLMYWLTGEGGQVSGFEEGNERASAMVVQSFIDFFL